MRSTERRYKCQGQIIVTGESKAVIFFVLGLLEECRGGGGFKVVGFWCLSHVPIMFCKFPKLFPNLFPIASQFYTITFAKNPRN